ncbi:hypothetical protein [Noviherbaspirillum sp.]|uniref:hypothetical protein n=1 Tax=Noviherbaspirillum sp. TaxID=1926288 RepID=UPI002B49DCDF|nr:hypothetical protein [Noviherbaspirillum sp.]HJV80435.1 hypothetical protein [Noviherbaspirillum sp.]
MNITDDMLTAAITKAVEAGLLPRRSLREDIAEARLLMRDILKAALAPTRQAKSAIAASSFLSSFRARERLAERPEYLRAVEEQNQA